MAFRPARRPALLVALLTLFLGLAAAPGTAMAAGPVVTTGPATSVTGHKVTLNGTINPQGSQQNHYIFGLAPSSSDWCMSGGPSPPSDRGPGGTRSAAGPFPYTDSSDHPVSAVVSELTPSTTYCYRLFSSQLGSVSNPGSGNTPGSLATFTTGPSVTLTVHVTGPGSVSGPFSSESGGDYTECVGTYAGSFGSLCTVDVANGDVVKLGAKIDGDVPEKAGVGSRPQAQFAGWSGACSGTEPSCTVTISGDTRVDATFTSEAAQPSAAVVDEALAALLTPSGPTSIAAILKAGGGHATFRAPSAGTAQIAWYQGSTSARSARAQKPLLVAKGSETYLARTHSVTIKIKLTPKGKALLAKVKKGQKLALTAKASFTPEDGKKTSKQKRFTLKG